MTDQHSDLYRTPLTWHEATTVLCDLSWEGVWDGLAETNVRPLAGGVIKALQDAGYVIVKKQEPKEPQVTDPRCDGTLGDRPPWMSPDQYDACRCTLPTGHEGDHQCEHTGGSAWVETRAWPALHNGEHRGESAES